MPLQEVSSFPEFQDVPVVPDVVVTFTGLLLMRFDDEGNGFQAGVVPADFHQLRIAIELRDATKKLVEKWEHRGPLTDDFWIDVQNPAVSGLNVYKHGATLKRLQTPKAQKKDFRWVLNLQQFHENKLEVKAESLNREIRLNNGIFFAHKLFSSGAKPKLALSKRKEFHLSGSASEAGIIVDPTESKALLIQTLAQFVGVNIYLQDGGKIQLRLGNQSNLFPDLLKPKTGEQYKITVNNDCCFGKDAETPEEIESDLPMYYKVISNVPKEDIPDLTMPNMGTTEIPCMPVLG